MKLTFTSEQWSAMLPAISQIDGGCKSCINSFLVELCEKFVLTKEMLEEVYYGFDSKLDTEDIEYFLKRMVEA